MPDPRSIATSIVGEIDWSTEVHGVCQCPGILSHTKTNKPKDCSIFLDNVPTIHCFHSSCGGAVAEANRKLRSALNGVQWSITLPGGKVLRNGDCLKPNGEIEKREVVAIGKLYDGIPKNEAFTLASIRHAASLYKGYVFERFHWPVSKIIEDSPLKVEYREPDHQFRTWLKLWPACSTVWIGDVYSSGKPEHKTHFRPVSEWYGIGPVMGNFTCGSSFKPGCHSRSNDNLNGHRFLVIESDTVPKDNMGAIFGFLIHKLNYQMHCVIDTAGRSLHGWFDAPPSKLFEGRLKAALEEFGCDPKVFTYSQPVRVPGAIRDGKVQKLLWLRDGAL